jgi:hypothetical protein
MKPALLTIETGLGHVLIEGVAEHVERYTHCAVLLIPSKSDKERNQNEITQDRCSCLARHHPVEA